MNDELEIKVKRRRVQPITFRLDDDPHSYTFNPPKDAVMVLPMIESGDISDGAQTKAAFNWLGEGLSEDDNKRLIGRLRDPKDDLDVETISELVQALTEKVSGGRPTT